jgi:DNA-directed RNA polymerase subunit RPC12/RpoP
MITVQCRECGDDVSSMWITQDEIVVCSDCGSQ